MKKINFLLLSLLGIALLASCESEKDDLTNPLLNDNQVKFQGTIGAAVSTRATGTAWDAGDAIGVYALTANQTLPSGIYDGKANVKYTTPGDGVFTGATTVITFPDEGDLDFIAYYPYQESITDFTYTINVADQSNPAAIDLLYSNNAKGANKSTPSVDLGFKHQLSLLVLNIAAGDGVESLNGLTASVSDLKTDGTFSLADGTITTGSTSNTITPVVSASGTSGTVTAILVPGQDLSSSKITFSLAGKTYEWAPGAQALESGKRYTYSLQLTTTGIATLQPNATIIDWEDASTGIGDIILTPDETPQFITDKTTVSLPASGTLTDVINLTTQSDQAWTASSDQTWLTVTPSGTGSAGISLTAEENTGGERTATVTITPSGATEFSPVTVTVTQEEASVTPPVGTNLFPGSDFEDWDAFLGALNSYGLTGSAYTSQSNDGRNGTKALYLNGTPSANGYVFTATVPDGFSLDGKSKIIFHIKGTAAKSLSLNVYVGAGTTMGTDYKCYNLGTYSEPGTLEPTSSNSYTGTIDTNGEWVKVTLNISDLTINSTAGLNLFALKVGGTAAYDLLVDDITLE